LPKVAGTSLYEQLPRLLQALPHLQPATTAMGIASLLVVALWPRIPVVGRIPGPMVALVAATVVSAVFHPAGVATIGSVFGGIPRGLPPLTIPHLSWGTVLELVQPAIAVALLGAIESLLSATVADGMMGTRHDPNQELVGQGIANMGAALFGGFAATGAVARTATSVRHGGDSPIAGIAHAATIALVLLVLAPLAFYVPLAALAAILFVVAFNMSQVSRVLRIARRAPRSDVAVMVITVALCVFANIAVAVEVGVILALLNFFRRMTSAVEVRSLNDEELASRLPAQQAEDVPEDVIVYTVDGPFFFGAIEQFESALLHTDTDPRAIVLKLVNVPFIDLTGLVALKDAVEALGKRGVIVALCCANADVAARLERVHVVSGVPVPPTASLSEAVQAVTVLLAS
jgi:SulP family sulfate permease